MTDSKTLRRAAFYLVGGAFAFVSMTAAIKALGGQVHIAQTLLVRQTVILCFLMPVILRTGLRTFHSAQPLVQCGRSIAAALGMLTTFTAVVYLPLDTVTAIGFSKVIFLVILAAIFLGEAVDRRAWAAVVAGAIGVLVMLQPSSQGLSIFGLLALVGAALEAGVVILVRKASQTDSTQTIIAWQAVGVGLLMAPIAVWNWSSVDFTIWGLMILIGVLAYGAQIGLVTAYSLANASKLAPLEYSRLIIAVLLGVLLFGSWPDSTTLIGAAFIVAASFIVMRRAPAQRP